MSDTIQVLQLLPAFAMGGAEMSVLHLAAALNPQHIRPHVCVMFDRGERALLPQFEKIGVPIHCLHCPRLYSPTSFARIANYVRQNNIDVIHTQLTPANILGRLTGKALGVPVISTLQNVPQSLSATRPDRLWLDRLTAVYMTDELVAVADHVRREYLHEWKLPSQRIKVIYNTVPLDKFKHIPEKPIRSEWSGSPVIMNIARLVPNKAQDMLIEAARIVLAKHPNAQFVLVGEGNERERLLHLIRSYGIEKQVVLTGLRHDIPELLAQADLFVLSSRHEGLPLSAVEAMAAGRPVVVTDVGGNRELVTSGVNGLIMPSGDSVRFATALIEMIEQPERRLAYGRAAREFVSRQFAIQTIAEQYEELYEHMARAKRQGRMLPIAIDK